ncbi:MAG: hypothetical protein WCR31_00490 [Treponema sp.]
MVSCAATSQLPELQTPAEEKLSPTEEIFSDWEYRGFGRELPVWVEPYFRGGVAAVQTACPEYEGKKLRIVCASGKNADQAEQALAAAITDNTVLNGYILQDSMWVCLLQPEDIALYGGNTYVSLYLYVEKVR